MKEAPLQISTVGKIPSARGLRGLGGYQRFGRKRSLEFDLGGLFGLLSSHTHKSITGGTKKPFQNWGANSRERAWEFLQGHIC